MKKLVAFMVVIILCGSMIGVAQDKQKGKMNSTTTQATVQGTDKPGDGDKVVTGKKGPDGLAVYEGAKGGLYYINKNGNKTYLTQMKILFRAKKVRMAKQFI